MSRQDQKLVDDLESAFIDELTERDRNGPESYRILYDHLNRDGNWNNSAFDRISQSMEDLYYFYLDFYPTWVESKVFDRAVKDSLDFTWANLVYKDRSIDLTREEEEDMNTILDDMNNVDRQRANAREGGRRRNDYDRRQEGYGSNQARQGVRTGRRTHTVSDNDGDSPYTQHAFRNGTQSNSWENEPDTGRIQERRERRQGRRPMPDEGSSPYAKAAPVETVEPVREEKVFTITEPRTPGQVRYDEVMARINGKPYLKERDGRYYITDWKAIETYDLICKYPHVAQLGCEPHLECLFAWIGDDGFVYQKKVSKSKMNIEDHKYVVQPGRSVLGPAPVEAMRPLNTPRKVEISDKNPIMDEIYEIIKDQKEKGLLPKNIHTFADVSKFISVDRAAEIMDLARKNLVKYLTEKEIALEQEKKVSVPASEKLQAVFNMREVDVVDQTTGEKNVDMQQIEKAVEIRTLNDGLNKIIAKQIKEELVDVGTSIPFEKLELFNYATTKEELDRVKVLLQPFRPQSKNFKQAFGILQENTLPRELRSMLERRGRDIVNELLGKCLGLNKWTIDNFIEDYVDLTKMLAERIKQGLLSEEQYGVFYTQLELRFCNLIFPDLESMKRHFPMLSEEELAVQQASCVFTYDFGSLVYIPYLSEDAGIKDNQQTLISQNDRHRAVIATSGLDLSLQTIIATKDRRFYRVVPMQDNLLLYPIEELK